MTDTLPLDDALQVLSNRRRRLLIELLADVPQVTASEAADELHTHFDEGARYESVYISLTQTHLDELASTDIIRVDETDKTIRRGPHFDKVHTVLNCAHQTLTTNDSPEPASATADPESTDEEVLPSAESSQ